MTGAPAEDQARGWSFDELVQEGLALIPAYAPQWTNHNPSDPGITLLELLAYLTEILAYRALRITPDAKLHFLRLLEGRTVSPNDVLIGEPATVIEASIRTRVQALAHTQCAVTPDDFQRLAVDAAASYLDGRPGLLAKCIHGVDPRRGLDMLHLAAAEAPADVTIVLAVARELPRDMVDGLCRHVQQALAPRCLLTTRVHVVPATHLHVSISCRISPKPGVPLSVAVAAVDAALRRRFDPLRFEEPNAGGQPFGRPLRLATIAATIDRTEEVDYVENIIVLRMSATDTIAEAESLVGLRIGTIARIGEDTRLGGSASVGTHRILTDRTGEAETILLNPWELAHVQLARGAVQGIDDEGFSGISGNRRRG